MRIQPAFPALVFPTATPRRYLATDANSFASTMSTAINWLSSAHSAAGYAQTGAELAGAASSIQMALSYVGDSRAMEAVPEAHSYAEDAARALSSALSSVNAGWNNLEPARSAALSSLDAASGYLASARIASGG